MNPKHRALKKKMSNADKALKHHEILASKEPKSKLEPIEKRIDKFSKWQNKLRKHK